MKPGKSMNFGISVYPDLRPLAEIEEYLQLAAKYGVTKLFTSMFSMEGTDEEIRNCFASLIQSAHSCGIAVSVDVNHQFLERMGAKSSDLKPFADLGVDEIRMDVPYGNEKDLELIRNTYGISICFNASLGMWDHLNYLTANGAGPQNMTLCHNFYPQRYTGMKWDTFLKTNERINAMGIPVGAFVTSHAENTHGVWDAKDGLCTVERMRDLPIDLQARMLLAAGTDEIIIGNAYATEDEFKALHEVLDPITVDTNTPVFQMMMRLGNRDHVDLPSYNIIRLELSDGLSDLEKEILFDYFPHQDLGDSSEWLWRSRMPRYVYRGHRIEPRPVDTDHFEVGDVMIVNSNYPNYAGEIQIVTLPIRNDGTRNYLGHIGSDEMQLLSLLKEREAIVFRSKS